MALRSSAVPGVWSFLRVTHNGAHRLYVPHYHGLRSKLLHDFHDLEVAGHFRWNKTYGAIAQHYYWLAMSAAVQE